VSVVVAETTSTVRVPGRVCWVSDKVGMPAVARGLLKRMIQNPIQDRTGKPAICLKLDVRGLKLAALHEKALRTA
jgi:hypothetical protein